MPAIPSQVSYVKRSTLGGRHFGPQPMCEATSNKESVEALSLAGAARLMRLGEDSLRELILMGEIPALSLNRKHIVLLREDIVSFIRNHAKHQQDQRRASWQLAMRKSEHAGAKYVARKPGRKRDPIPNLSEQPIDCRKALSKKRGNTLA